MQVQSFDGIWENGNFSSLGLPIRKKGKQRAILTLLDEPIRDSKINAADSPIEWLTQMDEDLEISLEEEMPDFTPRQPIRKPHGIIN